MPRHFKQFREKLIKASSSFRQRPDPSLDQIDIAFQTNYYDPDDEECQGIDEYEVRDIFLEFMTGCMKDYSSYIRDPGQQEAGEDLVLANSFYFFDFDKFRRDQGATRQTSFIYKMTTTTMFGNFIEARCLGKTEFDDQIMYFDEL